MYQTCTDLQQSLERILARELEKCYKKSVRANDRRIVTKMEELFAKQSMITYTEPKFAERVVAVYKEMFAVAGLNAAEYADTFEQLYESAGKIRRAHLLSLQQDALSEEEVVTVSKLYKWYKRQGIPLDNMNNTFSALYGNIPEDTTDYLISCVVPPVEEDRHKDLVLAKQSWMMALSTALACGRMLLGREEFDKRLTFKEDDGMLQILLMAYAVARFAQNSLMEAQEDTVPVHVADILKEDFQKLLKECDTLQSKNISLSEQNDKLKREQRSALTAAVVPLEKQIKSLEAENKQLREELEAYAALQRAEEALDTEESEEEDDVTELLELPEEDTMFVGGSSSLRAKMALRHPRWVVEPSNVSGNWSGKVLFLLVSSISHKCYWNVLSHFEGMLICVRGQNIELLEERMRVGYTKACQKQA